MTVSFLDILLLTVPTILVIVGIYWTMKDAFFTFSENNNKRLDQLQQQNTEILKELDVLRKKLEETNTK